MPTTGAKAIVTMVKARFDATSFTPVVGAPEHGSINVLEDKTIAKVATALNTNHYQGDIGCLVLIIDKETMRQWQRTSPRRDTPSVNPI